ncbi:MAG: hypothetical protein R3330_18700, partial [Saprospiraceae bacterium]|nr:hypothetical protein [Saprospiraceae bacterium]
GVARFLYGIHGSLISPVFPEITIEMQTQAASFLASGGVAVQVNNPDVLVPVVPVDLVNRGSTQPAVDRNGKTRKGISGNPGGEILQRVRPVELGRGGSQK